MIELDTLERCFSGAIPAVLATCSADGVPNVTYISKANRVDDERLAISNQFMSKTARNLAANPRASLLLMDPTTSDEYRLSLRYERTERRGQVFDRLRHDVDAVAELSGMQDVFRLRAATIFRVLDIVQLSSNPGGSIPGVDDVAHAPSAELSALAALSARLSRSGDLDVLVDTALDGIVQLLGYGHVHLLLLDEQGRRLYTIGSRGFDAESIGAEVEVGDGPIGLAAARCEPVRIGDVRQMQRYSRAIRDQFEERGGVRPGREVHVPGLPRAGSRLIIPMAALGELVGVIVVESTRSAAFTECDEQLLGVVAAILGSAIEQARSVERTDAEPVMAPTAAPVYPGGPINVRFFDVDGSTFLDGDYLIKGVAGRILWAVLGQHVDHGRVDFTNRELRLDRRLELPGVKDNLESRLILLKRRLDERAAPIRIERSGRGRFRLLVDGPVRLSAE